MCTRLGIEWPPRAHIILEDASSPSPGVAKDPAGLGGAASALAEEHLAAAVGVLQAGGGKGLSVGGEADLLVIPATGAEAVEAELQVEEVEVEETKKRWRRRGGAGGRRTRSARASR